MNPHDHGQPRSPTSGSQLPRPRQAVPVRVMHVLAWTYLQRGLTTTEPPPRNRIKRIDSEEVFRSPL
jgi:hypothetical protein